MIKQNTKDFFATLMCDLGKMSRANGCRQKGINNFLVFCCPYRDKFVFDDEALLDMYHRIPQKNVSTFMVPK